MPDINVRPRTLHTRMLLAGLAAGAILGAAIANTPPARADGTLDPDEARYVTRYHSAVCGTLDVYPTKAGVLGVMSAIVDDGYKPDSAVDIINASVDVYCHDHWALLVSIGDQPRGPHTTGAVGGTFRA